MALLNFGLVVVVCSYLVVWGRQMERMRLVVESVEHGGEMTQEEVIVVRDLLAEAYRLHRELTP